MVCAAGRGEWAGWRPREATIGSIEAAETLEEIAASLRQNNKPAPPRDVQH
jgi:hypothetical protein